MKILKRSAGESSRTRSASASVLMALCGLLMAAAPGFAESGTDWITGLAPDAPIVAHGMNNSTQLLPLGQGMAAQEAYIAKTLDLLEKDTGKRPTGWQSPSVYPNADTFSAITAKGVTYTVDGMDSDTLS